MNTRLMKALMAAGMMALSAGARARLDPGPVEVLSSDPHVVPVGARLHAARQAALHWARTGVAPALTGANGEIRYAYGESHPRVVCAPLHLCVITLLRHEKIVNLSLGDSVRWLAQPAQAGDRPVIVIKPTVPGLSTNLVVTTDDGHLYYLDLVSVARRFVPQIGFYDPQALVATIHRARALKTAQARTVVASLPAVSPDRLDFAYWWEGPRAERPVRVFSAAGKVYIQMPSHIRDGDAPALFVVDHGAEQLVNYRMAGAYFVVDELFRKARLILGTGDRRRVVTIHAGHRPLFPW